MSVIKEFNAIRERLQTFADLVNEGELNAFEVGREISYTKKCIDQVKEKIAEAEMNEFNKYQPQELKAMKIQMSGGGYTFKFDHIKAWTNKYNELKDIEEKAKNAFYAAKKDQLLIDNTGEEIVIAEGTPRKQSVSYK